MASRAGLVLRPHLLRVRRLQTPCLASSIRGYTPPSNVMRHISPLAFGMRRMYATSEKTHEPASKDVGEMVHNAKTEAKAVASSVLESVSGQGGKRGGVLGGASGMSTASHEVASDLKSLETLLEVVPRGAIVFGAAGVIPYIATSATTIWFARQVWLADQNTGASSMDVETALALMYHNETIQVTYGAVLLSFLGAIHWGFEFSKYGGVQGTNRYALGVAPAMLAWPTLLLPGQVALAAQWATFTAVWYMDMIATGKGWTPSYYSTYRFALTAVVGSLILLTLGATSYWSPSGQGHLTTAQKLAQVQSRGERSKDDAMSGVKIQGKLTGASDMNAKSDQDAYVRFENVKAEREKRAKEEEEEREKEKEKAAQKAKDTKHDTNAK